MEGWLAFGSIVFLFIFIKMVLKSSKVDTSKTSGDINSSSEHKHNKENHINNNDCYDNNVINYRDGYERHVKFMRNLKRRSPSYSHLPGNVWNND